jgi:hypothetical protein
MADVNIQQTPNSSGSGSGTNFAWALVVLVLLGVIGWFVFGGGITRKSQTTIDVNVPNAPAPAAPAAPNATPPGGGAKTP